VIGKVWWRRSRIKRGCRTSKRMRLEAEIETYMYNYDDERVDPVGWMVNNWRM